jgi:putative spermidine/putrescine transport system permease protein
MKRAPRTILLVVAALLLPVLLATVIFFGAPLGLLGLESVHRHAHGGTGGLVFSYGRLLAHPLYRRLLGETFKLAALCTIFCLLAGYPLAWGLRIASDRLRRLLVFGVFAPLLVGVVMRGFGWLVVLGEFGLVNLVLRTLRLEAELTRRSHLMSELALLGGMVQVFFPFMVLALYRAVQKIDLALVQTARSLGATRWRAFVEVVLPLSLPGAAAGVLTVFALATGAFITVAVAGGVRVHRMAEWAYEESNTLISWQLGAALVVTLLFGVAFLVRLLLHGLRRPDEARQGLRP